MSKQFYFKELSLEKVHSLVLSDPKIELYQVLLLRARDLGAMAIKGLSTFSKAPVLLEPHHQIV